MPHLHSLGKALSTYEHDRKGNRYLRRADPVRDLTLGISGMPVWLSIFNQTTLVTIY